MSIAVANRPSDGSEGPDGSTPGPVAVSIVGYRNPDDICACLAALEQSTASDFIVLICENGGVDSYRRLVEMFAGILQPDRDVPAVATDRVAEAWRGRMPGGQIVEVLCAEDNLGYAGGVNTTVKRLAAYDGWRAVWVLNPDTQPDEGALAGLIAKAASDPSYGVIGSRLVLKASNTIQAYGGRWRTLMGRGFNIGLHQSAEAITDAKAIEREMTYVLGASMYVTRSFIDAVGLMDEQYFLYVEEVDWCFRRGAFKLGYAGDSVVNHLHGSTLGSNVTRRFRSRLSVYLDERNKHIFSKKFFPHLYPLIAISTLALTAQYLKAAAWRNFLFALSGWWGGVTGKVGKPVWMR